jgi:hypothetical protein
MATKKRYIDVLSAKLDFPEDSVSTVTFADVLRFMNEKEYRHYEKIFEFSLLTTDIENCLTGIIITTQDKDIPPKRHKHNKSFSKLEIDATIEGLAFANIFLYDIQRNVFLYEINRNGCFPNQLRDFIYATWNSEDENTRFELSFPAILRANEYQRMLEMNYYKRLIVELYKPTELINCFNEETDSLENNILKENIGLGIRNNADVITLEQVAMNKKLNPLGLSHDRVKGMIDAVKLGIADCGLRPNIKTLRIEGYTGDPEDRALKPIDILADTFNEYFKITDIQVQIDVQQQERKQGIEKLYNKLLPELRQLR